MRADASKRSDEADRPNYAPPQLDAERGGQIRRLAKALSGVKRRVHHPKLPNDACYAGVAYRLPEPPTAAAKALFELLGPLPKSMSLDRIDPCGHYALDNLQYATAKQQTANRRPIRRRSTDEDDE